MNEHATNDPTEPALAIIARIKQTRNTGEGNWVRVSDETGADREIRAFTAQWPAVARILGIAGVRSFRLFEPGLTVRPRGGREDGIPWWHYLERHMGGDYGLLGRFEDAPPDDLGEEYSCSARQSWLAIRAEGGVIRSRFLLPGQDGPGTVEAVTVLSPLPGETVTLMTLGAPVLDGQGGRG